MITNIVYNHNNIKARKLEKYKVVKQRIIFARSETLSWECRARKINLKSEIKTSQKDRASLIKTNYKVWFNICRHAYVLSSWVNENASFTFLIA